MNPVSLYTWLLVGFLVKHFIADFLLQTVWMARNKGTFLHPGGLAHVAIHMVATLVVLMALAPLGTHGITLFALIVGEGVIHYFIDLSKMKLDRKLSYSTPQFDANGKLTGLLITSNNYYLLLGFDQLLHGLTYAAMLHYLLA